jgi:hypothetical protein
MTFLSKLQAFFTGVLTQVEGNPAGVAAVNQLNSGLKTVETQLVTMAEAGIAPFLAMAPLGLGADVAPLADAFLVAGMNEIGKYVSIPIVVTAPVAPATKAAPVEPADPVA